MGISPLNIGKTFYFDESNNIKKGIIGAKDNNKDLENLYFVLGGIAVSNHVDFDDLLDYVGAKQTPIDAKFSFFSLKNNSFVNAISQRRLRRFFEYLLEKKILIHFDVLHIMHFALVDILDSLIEEKDANQEVALTYYKELQSDMTEVLYKNYNALHDLLVSFEFPNVSREDANKFIIQILNLYTQNLEFYDRNDYKNFTKELLRQLIKAKRDKTNLTFLENNKSFLVFDNVFNHYLLRMIEIKDNKYFDNEASIIKQLNSESNYSEKLQVHFVDSKKYREIQLSDVVCGFVAKLYNFLSHNDEKELKSLFDELDVNDEIYKTLDSFFKLMELSNKVSPIMFKKTVPLFIERRLNFLSYLVNNKS